MEMGEGSSVNNNFMIVEDLMNLPSPLRTQLHLS
jgi:hypothetical protein